MPNNQTKNKKRDPMIEATPQSAEVPTPLPEYLCDLLQPLYAVADMVGTDSDDMASAGALLENYSDLLTGDAEPTPESSFLASCAEIMQDHANPDMALVIRHLCEQIGARLFAIGEQLEAKRPAHANETEKTHANLVDLWINACCIVDPNDPVTRERPGNLYNSFCLFCMHDLNVAPISLLSTGQFYLEMRQRFERVSIAERAKAATSRVYFQGITIKDGVRGVVS